MSARLSIAIASIYGFLAVALGAFGAHALKGRLPENLLAAYQTGVHYQLAHALALLLVGSLLHRPWLAQQWLRRAAALFALGVLLFSGSLYGLTLGGMTWLGPVTPLGGVCLLLAWCFVFLSALAAAPAGKE